MNETQKLIEHVDRLTLALSILEEYGVEPSPRQRALLRWYEERLEDEYRVAQQESDRFHSRWDRVVRESDLDDPDDPKLN